MSDPNAWSPVVVKNSWGSEMTNVQVSHRYDSDHYDHHTWNAIRSGDEVGGMQAGYWTGFGRTGKDYWHITFQSDGHVWTCKDNFYCFLTSADAKSGKAVVLEIKKTEMDVVPPESSGCYVSLNQVG